MATVADQGPKSPTKFKGPAISIDTPAAENGTPPASAKSPRNLKFSPPASPRGLDPSSPRKIASAAAPSINSPRRTTTAVKWIGMYECNLQEPLYRFSTYLRGDWASDLINLYHNGLKREVQDLYCMISSMLKRKDKLVDQEFEQLDTWYELFSDLLNWYLQFDETSLIPFIEKIANKGSLQFGAQERNAMADKRRIIGLELNKVLQFLTTTSAQVQSRPSISQGKEPINPELVTQLIHVNDAFVEALMDYLLYEEVTFLPMITGQVSQAEKEKFEDEVFVSLHDAGVDGHMRFLILLRGIQMIEGKDAADVIKNRYLNQYSVVSFKNKKVAKMYVMSRDLWVEKHINIFKEFAERWNLVAQENLKYKFEQLGSGRLDVRLEQGSGFGSGRLMNQLTNQLSRLKSTK